MNTVVETITVLLADDHEIVRQGLKALLVPLKLFQRLRVGDRLWHSASAVWERDLCPASLPE